VDLTVLRRGRPLYVLAAAQKIGGSSPSPGGRIFGGMSEQPTRYKIYVDTISMGQPTTSGRSKRSSMTREAARLRQELATQGVGMTGQEPPNVTVPIQAIKWLGELGGRSDPHSPAKARLQAFCAFARGVPARAGRRQRPQECPHARSGLAGPGAE
jgi:hypothetical protein